MMSSIKEGVIAAIRDACAPAEPDVSNHDRPLLESGLDSLDFASVLMALEDKFGVVLLDDTNVDALNSINAIVSRIEALRAA